MAVEWGLVTWAADKIWPHLPSLLRGGKGIQGNVWVPQLNRRFQGEAVVHGAYRYEPLIQIDGTYTLTAEQSAFAQQERRQLAFTQPNDPHALLAAEPHWDDDPLHLRVRTLDFAAVRALRQPELNPDPRPPLISANMVLLCRETRQVILHRRAESSDTYAGALHTFGGAYWPPGVDGREADKHSLRNTAVREVMEETEASLSLDDEPPMVVLLEVKTGFVQLTFLGVNVSARQAQLISPNREGTIVRVGFDDLPGRLMREDWVPTGRAALLAWLAMGAPNAGWRPRFGGRSPSRLFTQLVA